MALDEGEVSKPSQLPGDVIFQYKKTAPHNHAPCLVRTIFIFHLQGIKTLTNKVVVAFLEVIYSWQ
jgi:hypothetical protein